MKKSSSSQRGAVFFGVALLACLVGANLWTWVQKSQEEKRELVIEVLPEEILEVSAPEWEDPTDSEPTTAAPDPSPVGGQVPLPDDGRENGNQNGAPTDE